MSTDINAAAAAITYAFVQCVQRLLILLRGGIVIKVAFPRVKYVCLREGYGFPKRFLVLVEIFR